MDLSIGFVWAVVITFWKSAQENVTVQKPFHAAKTLCILVNALHFFLSKTILCLLQSPTLLIKLVMAHATDGQ